MIGSSYCENVDIRAISSKKVSVISKSTNFFTNFYFTFTNAVSMNQGFAEKKK
ncbi:hypothetical protein BC643_4224 [Mangrovibacterium diazotrophicum]|uniref:Uncharacterized protein n=1 Tax=Mangrovibacterium diazotrophicum TaxID=1261403 RepID=A0A419VWS4_9BACT|nr:hypothetical protein BC643_4224 [Mangrovibacterium diazotrophicum]